MAAARHNYEIKCGHCGGRVVDLTCRDCGKTPFVEPIEETRAERIQRHIHTVRSAYRKGWIKQTRKQYNIDMDAYDYTWCGKTKQMIPTPITSEDELNTEEPAA